MSKKLHQKYENIFDGVFLTRGMRIDIIRDDGSKGDSEQSKSVYYYIRSDLANVIKNKKSTEKNCIGRKF